MEYAIFKNREEAAQALETPLSPYRKQACLVLALPRGGVPLAAYLAKSLGCPMNLLFAHKIGHPYQPEYAIAAVSEKGYLVTNPHETIDPVWVEKQKVKTLQEIQHKRALYQPPPFPKKISDLTLILIDDGVATGLTLKAALLEAKSLHPKSLVVAVPVAPSSTYEELKQLADQVIALRVDPPGKFLGSVGAYYEEFAPVQDQEVIKALQSQKPS